MLMWARRWCLLRTSRMHSRRSSLKPTRAGQQSGPASPAHGRSQSWPWVSGLVGVNVLLGAVNIMLTVLVLMVVVASSN
uniref:Uncharacterized protein n=1 Tax=Triticum urartu TaxID=4572 RepID=A0A8R7QAR3_TRIUA